MIPGSARFDGAAARSADRAGPACPHQVRAGVTPDLRLAPWVIDQGEPLVAGRIVSESRSSESSLRLISPMRLSGGTARLAAR